MNADLLIQAVSLRTLDVVDPRHKLFEGPDPRPQFKHRLVGEKGFRGREFADHHWDPQSSFGRPPNFP